MLAVGLFIGGSIAAGFYDVYGFHPEKNAQLWAAREPAFTSGSDCQACHGAEWNTHIASSHDVVACESCHGPLRAHAADPATAPAPEPPAASSETWERGFCARCHESTTGHPESFPQVSLEGHYVSGLCLACHDPHSTAARQPPVVSHPLDFLPACTVCHNPQGLKQLPVGHEEAADEVCLGCHAAGASGLTGVSR